MGCTPTAASILQQFGRLSGPPVPVTGSTGPSTTTTTTTTSTDTTTTTTTTGTTTNPTPNPKNPTVDASSASQ